MHQRDGASHDEAAAVYMLLVSKLVCLKLLTKLGVHITRPRWLLFPFFMLILFIWATELDTECKIRLFCQKRSIILNFYASNFKDPEAVL